MEIVCVRFGYEYAGRDGRVVSIKPNESYILLAKTNQHWWHVCKDQHSRPFYVPAQYVTELPSYTETSEASAETEAVTKLEEIFDRTVDVQIETNSLSTFGFCDNPPDMELGETQHPAGDTKAPPDADALQNLYAKPHHLGMERFGETKTIKAAKSTNDKKAYLDEEGFPLPPNLPIYETIPELSPSDVIITSSEPANPVALNDASHQQSLNHVYALDDQVGHHSLYRLIRH